MDGGKLEFRVRCVRLANGECKECTSNQQKCRFDVLPKKRGPKPRSGQLRSSSETVITDQFVNYTGTELPSPTKPYLDPIQECLKLIYQLNLDPHFIIPTKKLLQKIGSSKGLDTSWDQLVYEILATLRNLNPQVNFTLVYTLAALGHTLTHHPSAAVFYEWALDAAQILQEDGTHLPILSTLLHVCYDHLQPIPTRITG
ncbi:hypothetical protein L0F63_001413 [Massospora cicadina]|nr:hypothetical protein L0F63_001413 [Massospora cicadina]